MYRHRRHFSLDSHSILSRSSSTSIRPYPPSSPAISPSTSIRSSYTLQCSPTGGGIAKAGPRTARLQQHTSPLAIMQAITPASPIDEGFGMPGASVLLDGRALAKEGEGKGELEVEVERESGVSDEEMEVQMERMVESVVTSPTHPNDTASLAQTTLSSITSMSTSASSGTSSSATAAALGLGLPSALAERRAASSSSMRSLMSAAVGAVTIENVPKFKMGMRAAVGNYRKRIVSGSESATSLSSRAVSPPPQLTVSQHDSDRSLSISTPGDTPTPSVLSYSSRLTSHRRSVSAGSMPSLSQIAEWSQRRQQQQAHHTQVTRDVREGLEALAPGIEETVHATLAQGFQVPRSSVVLVAPRLSPLIHLHHRTASSPITLTRRQETPDEDARTGPSTPSIVLSPVLSTLSPARSPQQARTPQPLRSPFSMSSGSENRSTAGGGGEKDGAGDRRTRCARQMVNVLEKRRSVSMGNAAGIMA